ncbi:MAG: GatB/YqeY domain-containing protein [Clostridia bacterium]
MKLTDQLVQDFKKYLIAKDTIRKNTIQMLRAEILNKSKELHRDLNENEILGIISKEIKQKRTTIEEFKKADRKDLIEETEIEILTLEVYMPQPLTRDELKSIIAETMSELNIYQMNGMGTIIREVKAQVGVKADGKTISELVKEALV